ncbi:hypothetical protein ALC62_04019 [Cyphomyrmex costatus]|uniref:DUF4218 domain-containing protein n=1 Tax=Cyphomyrmex costatus TaxID=456900 RepID=A0A151IKN2_9HYME|nr:hypothetical protein ALC62_04019 [Cyphomyrmex costatus]
MFKIKYFKRRLERKVNKVEHKTARLERISLILHESFNDVVFNNECRQDCSSSNDESQSEDSIIQEGRIQEDCTATVSTNLDGNDDYNDNFDDNNQSNGNIDINGSVGDSSSNGYDSDDSGSTESTNFDTDRDHNQIELYFENDKEKEAYFIKVLRIWALQSGLLSMRKLDSLLAQLKPLFHNIPLSYKTLLDTPSSIQIMQITGGQLWYKGITTNLNSMNLKSYLEIHKKIVIDVNADGLPLFKSSREHFWPLLGRLVGTKNQPFVISLTLFQSAIVSELHEFLYYFVNEIHYLKENGYMYNDQRFEFCIQNFICDAPARSFMKGIVEHGAYFACEKTNESFINRDQSNHHRHNNQSPLEELGIGMVSQFPLDGMHLVYLGVFRRLLLAWQKWNGPWKLHVRTVAQISDDLLVGKTTCPQDFNRKPRNLNELKYYKATEFRRLLLYDGIVVLKNHLNENIYKHFLLLHCAIYILSSPSLVQTFCHYAEEFLNIFISHSVVIYGQKFVVYNVHSLCHLAQECYLHGDLESFSAFVFENKLKSLKASLKSGYKPLQQAAFRDIESSENIDIIMDKKDNQVTLSMSHFYDNEVLNGQQYRRISINNVVLQLNGKDSYVKMNNEEVIAIVNIVQRDDRVFLIGHAFLRSEDFYQYPISSSLLGICMVSHKDEQRKIFPISDIKAKCWMIPYEECYVCIPLLHTSPIFN